MNNEYKQVYIFLIKGEIHTHTHIESSHVYAQSFRHTHIHVVKETITFQLAWMNFFVENEWDYGSMRNKDGRIREKKLCHLVAFPWESVL